MPADALTCGYRSASEIFSLCPLSFLYATFKQEPTISLVLADQMLKGKTGTELAAHVLWDSACDYVQH